MDFVGVDAGDVIADIGAGRGYYTVKLAKRVGPGGHIYAEDIISETVAALRTRAASTGTVTAVLGTHVDPKLPTAPLDTATPVHLSHQIVHSYSILCHLPVYHNKH